MIWRMLNAFDMKQSDLLRFRQFFFLNDLASDVMIRYTRDNGCCWMDEIWRLVNTFRRMPRLEASSHAALVTDASQMLHLIPKWDPVTVFHSGKRAFQKHRNFVSCEGFSFFGHPEPQGAVAPLLLAVAAVSEQLAKDQSSDWDVLESNFFPLGPSSSKPWGEMPQILQETLSDEVRMPRKCWFFDLMWSYMSLMARVCQKHKNCWVFDSTKLFATLFSRHPLMVVMVLCRCLQHHKIEDALITIQSSVSDMHLCQWAVQRNEELCNPYSSLSFFIPWCQKSQKHDFRAMLCSIHGWAFCSNSNAPDLKLKKQTSYAALTRACQWLCPMSSNCICSTWLTKNVLDIS